MGEFSIWHWLIVIVIVLLLFGRGKISDLMGDVAQGIKSFKKGIAEDDKPAQSQSNEMKAIDHPDKGEVPPSEAVRHTESTNT
jgi:sec-independent protein translocase protein TatA